MNNIYTKSKVTKYQYAKYIKIIFCLLLSCFFFLWSCKKDTPLGTNNLTLLGNWTFIKEVTKTTYSNSSIQNDSTIFSPKGITAEFKSDSTIIVKEWAGGSIYITDIQSFKVKDGYLYWTKYWTPTIIDTFKIEVFSSTKLTLYRKTISSTETVESRDYWERY